MLIFEIITKVLQKRTFFVPLQSLTYESSFDQTGNDRKLYARSGPKQAFL